ncbi:MAG: DUF5752 family protein [Acidobacteriota bacterium]
MSPTPYVLYTCVALREILNRRAHGEQELLQGIDEVDEAAIYYHTHSYYLHGKYEYDRYPNDFANWVAESVRDQVLSERLAVLDPFELGNAELLREELVTVIDDHVNSLGFAPRLLSGEPFEFFRAHIISIPTGNSVRSREELRSAITTATPETLFYHFFEDAFRRGQRNGTLVKWVAEELGEEALALRLSGLNPYRLHLEHLRTEILSILDGAEEGADGGD